ncbi:UDP-N-acetylenolpyruvoylglucosamine reductase [Marinobacterium nitratireducens]|uniref:UDP-N-acetylenolpyruvoylglucosamine reductase n=1 Tax=Marinobacterium nitratireducens TaxID=518897 RepID=A0A918DWD2_9GAMM|nr:UDP-N-acetylenolpyruvoylglucosamine reductase [Marinobacterium nitratireducens]
MSVQQDVDLRALNTFGFAARAERFVRAQSLDMLQQAVVLARTEGWPLLLLGGGSNLVLRERIPGLVVQVALKGRAVRVEGDSVLATVAAGESWHDTVAWSLQQGYFGLENLALIPGTVGAAPMQNIGAYGVELEERFHELRALDIETGEICRFSRADCAFGYRDSLFKSRQPGRYVILDVTFALSCRPEPVLRYRALAEELQRRGIEQPTPQDVFDAVCSVRRSKLPDPALIGNAGSFFKNPVVTAAQYRSLRTAFPDLVAFEAGQDYKLAAGWLIDRCGWKGHRQGAVGVYPHQALVLVNEGEGCASELLRLADAITDSVRERFGVELEMEPRVYPARQGRIIKRLFAD